MAHKTLIDGTVYEISGGKTLIDGTAYKISSGKTLIGGTVYEVGFGGLPDDIDNSLEFASADAFSISVAEPAWDGTLEYCNGVGGWQRWDGSEISSRKTGRGHCIYIRGAGNTKIAGASTKSWTLTGTNIACNGNIETILDYAQVKTGVHPSMSVFCYAYMFNGCTSLTTVPSLPATEMQAYCYSNMFANCTSLTSVPALPATQLDMFCYADMFNGCTKIKVSSEQTGTYTQAYRIPTFGTTTGGLYSTNRMFAGTGGTFTSAPSINTTYYLDSSNTIVY